MDFRRLVSNGCHNRHRSPSEERYLKWLLFLFLSHRTSHDYSYLIFTEFVVFCYVFIPQVLLFFGHPSSFLHMSSVNWIISIATYRPRQFRFLFCCHAVRKNWLCILVDATSECVLYHLRIFFWQVYLLLLVCFRIHLLFFLHNWNGKQQHRHLEDDIKNMRVQIKKNVGMRDIQEK